LFTEQVPPGKQTVPLGQGLVELQRGGNPGRRPLSGGAGETGLVPGSSGLENCTHLPEIHICPMEQAGLQVKA